MKHIHIPTLIMHVLLLALARITVSDYPDFFLGFSIFVLILHGAWSMESQRSFLPARSLGLALYLLAQPLGFVSAEGIGGSFGWLFYGFALICSLVLESVIAIVRRLLQKT